MERVPIGTVVVGANVLLREGLVRILSAADFSIIASTSCADDHVLSTLPQGQPILLVIDVSDDFDAGLRQIESFKQRYPGGRVAVLADQHQLTEMVPAFRVGANAYLVKVATCETFIKSLELVMLGLTLLPPEILAFMSDRHEVVRFGAADYERNPGEEPADDAGTVAEAVWSEPGTAQDGRPAKFSSAPRLSARQELQGDSNKTIARTMVMAEATVKVHVKAILRKIVVYNRTQAAIWAMSDGRFIVAKDDALHEPESPPPEPLSLSLSL